MTERPSCYEAATRYLELGLHPIPCAPRSKRPLVEWRRYQTEAPLLDELDVWWEQWPEANVALVLGRGTFAVDLDGGADAERLLAEQGIVLPPAPRSRTASGFHVFLSSPDETVPDRVGLLRENGGKPQVDIRGVGIVVVPPSLHPSGVRYEWEVPLRIPFPKAPPRLLKLIKTPPGPESRPTENWVIEALAGVPEGLRDATCTRLAGYFLGLRLDAKTVEAILVETFAARCTPPFPESEVRKCVRSIARREAHSFLPYKGEVGKETNFRPLKAGDLLAQEPEPLIWMWEPFLPEGGLILLVAFMKVGKSTFVYALAIAVAQGRAFLGYPTKRGGVLILAVEEHPRDVKRRLRRFGMRPEDPIFVHTRRLDASPDALRTLRDFITQNETTLVILDTLARYWNIADENDNAQVVRWVSPLLDLARETGAAVLLVHHERKTGGEDGRAIRGGSALFGLVDQALLLDRRQGGESTHRVLRALGRYEETPAELILELVGNDYRKLGTPEELNREGAKRKVWEALSEEPRDVTTLAKEAGLKDNDVRRALEALGNQVIREGKGRKGDPYTYRRTLPDSIRSQPHPIGDETNPRVENASDTATVRLEEVDL